MICLFVVGAKILSRARTTNYSVAKFLAIGLLFVGFAILLYSIRDIFIQFGKINIQYSFYQAGVIFQTMGGLFIFAFIYKEFASKLFTWLTSPIIVGGAFLIMFAVLFLPTMQIVKEASLEPIRYVLINHPWESMAMNIAFLVIIVTFSFSIFSIFLYRTLKMKGRKAKMKGLLYGVGLFLLYIPTLISVFISPIFARIGYGIGALLIYRAFKIKT